MIEIKEVLISKSLIEERFCKPFEELKRHSMNDDLSKIMIQLLLGEIPEKLKKTLKKEFLYQVIEKRIESCFTFKITDLKLMLFLMALCETPGMAVMYITYLQYWCKQQNIKELNFDIFISKIFPWGFPSTEDLHKLWNYCKVKRDNSGGSDNLLDYANAAESIQFNN